MSGDGCYLQERFQLLKLYLEQYIVKAGTAEGGAGSGSVQGLGARFRALLTGKRLAAAEITVQGIDDSLLQVNTMAIPLHLNERCYLFELF